MYKLAKTAILFSVIFLFSFRVSAQDSTKCPMHHHGWPMGDSASMKDFSAAMGNFSMDDFPYCMHKKKYNGHWAGVELGFSGYLTSGGDMKFNPAYPFMNLNTARSLTVNINPFELNVNLLKNHIGFTTGLGLQFTNYYFTDNYVMVKDSAAITAYKVQDAHGQPVSMKVNKMVVTYLNLPLFFEYQTNPYRRMNSFHITVGVVAGVRIGTYTKQWYNSKEGSYFLVDNKGNKVASYDVDHYTVNDRGTYHLSPFKVDAAFRIGWSHLNLFSTYSITSMFQKDQGPALYPFTVGLTLLGW